QRTRGHAAQLPADHAADRPPECTYRASDPGRGDAGDSSQHRRGPANKAADATRDAAHPTEKFFTFKFALELAFALEFALQLKLPSDPASPLPAEQTAGNPAERAQELFAFELALAFQLALAFALPAEQTAGNPAERAQELFAFELAFAFQLQFQLF